MIGAMGFALGVDVGFVRFALFFVSLVAGGKCAPCQSRAWFVLYSTAVWCTVVRGLGVVSAILVVLIMG